MEIMLSKQLSDIILHVSTDSYQTQFLTDICHNFSLLHMQSEQFVDDFLMLLKSTLDDIMRQVSTNKKKYPTKKLEMDKLKNELNILFQNINFTSAINSTICPKLYTNTFFTYINYFDDTYLMDQSAGSILEFIFTMSKLTRYPTDFNNWKLFFKKIYENYPKVQIFLKGGSTIGLLLLKTYSYSDVNNASSTGLINPDGVGVNNLRLIRDFDFILEDVECCTDYFYYDFASEFNIVLNGKKSENGKKNQGATSPLHVMRSVYPIRVGDDCLFEMAVCIEDTKLELPMTCMKLIITKDNYIDLFVLLEKIHMGSVTQSDLEFLKQIDIIIPKCDLNGMFDVDTDAIHPGTLSDQIVNIIEKITSDKNYQQCLYYLVSNPTNLSRLKWKNIPKSDKIRFMYEQNSQLVPLWLLNNDLIINLVDKFIYELGLIVNDIYVEYASTISNIIQEINNLENDFAVCECNYDLMGIGGSATDVIAFLQYQNTNPSIGESPRISKLLSKKNLMHANVENMIDIVNKIGLKCDKYNVTYIPGKMESSMYYAQLKNSIKKKIFDVRKRLTDVYIPMFGKLAIIFEGMNMIRWKDNIESYRNLPNMHAISCITNIFNFLPSIRIKLDDGTNIITDSTTLSKNSIWLLFMEWDRTK